MLRLFLAVIFIFCLYPYASAEELTPEQQKELAKKIGVILMGMTKAEVRETFSIIEPEVWYTPDGQEVWFFKSPRKQNIYFNGDIVEKVEYTPPKKKPKGKSGLEL